MSVKFDSTEILDSTHTPRFVKHESASERSISTAPKAREDGDIYISSRYGQKRIVLQGILTGTSSADLEGKIDTFKELFSRAEKILLIDWGSGTVQFVATCAKHEFDRDHFNILFVPWTAEFIVTNGEGSDASATVLVNDVAHNLNVSAPYTENLTFGGTKAPRPYFRIKASTSFPGTTIKGVRIKNTTTGESAAVTFQNGSWSVDDYAVFDMDTLRTYLNRATVLGEVNFYGALPRFIVGVNAMEIRFGGIPCQESLDEGTDPSSLASVSLDDINNKQIAQSFEVPYTDGTFREINLALSKVGTPTRNLFVRIETDNAGKPSGSLVDANATLTIAASDVTGTQAWQVNAFDGEFTLTANTRYWIVIKPTSSGTVDGSNYFNIAVLGNTYERGTEAFTTNAGSSWAINTGIDIVFSLRYGGVRATGGTSGAWKLYVTYTKKYL